MNVREKELRIPYQSEEMCGVLYQPEQSGGRLPVIIVSHGFYASYDMMKETSERLAENGYMTYCFDYRGCSYTHRSGGDLQKCSILTEMDELNEIINYFKRLDSADEKNIYLLGQSMGGLVSALTAAKCVEDIAGLILMCPAMDMKEVCNQYFKDTDVIPEIVEDFTGIPGLNLGKVFFDDLYSVDFETILQYTKPVYLLHGTADELVPITYSRELAQKYNKAKLVEVPGEPHDFKLNKELAEDISCFLHENCRS